jgi:nicotinate phosphoribosyltransferase
VVYKLVETETDGVVEPKTKFSEEKVYWPGRKQVFRFSEAGQYHHDLLAGAQENYLQAAPLLEPVMQGGRRLAPAAPVKQLRERTLANLACLPEAYQALRDAPAYPVRKGAALDQLLDDIRFQRFGSMKSPQ